MIAYVLLVIAVLLLIYVFIENNKKQEKEIKKVEEKVNKDKNIVLVDKLPVEPQSLFYNGYWVDYYPGRYWNGYDYYYPNNRHSHHHDYHQNYVHDKRNRPNRHDRRH
jgi:hypothetical protein